MSIFEEYGAFNIVCMPPSVAHLDVGQTGDQEVVGSTPTGWQHSFVGIDHEIFSLVILSTDSRRAVVSF